MSGAHLSAEYLEEIRRSTAARRPVELDLLMHVAWLEGRVQDAEERARRLAEALYLARSCVPENTDAGEIIRAALAEDGKP